MVDVLVIGAGHAGIEAAHAAARRGACVTLLLLDRRSLGAMSCNPSIGGVGKGHIVREIDAFDGVMARAGDTAAIHYRMLNASKGAAVRGPRVQADRRRYAAAIAEATSAAGISIIEGEAVGLLLTGDRIAGVVLADGATLPARSIVIATGTFLGARMFRGDERQSGGRLGERAANRLGDQLGDLGIVSGRLKTGTPPRLDGRSIDWARIAEQASDPAPWRLSPLSADTRLPQIACGITRTTPATHDVIRAAMHRSPLRSGAIESGGPRYCPSIEDKVDRFADRDGHQLFLEPEGLDDPLVYPNGLSTSLPADVQIEMLRTVPGLERARIVAPGYAVEYRHIDPRLLDHQLKFRGIKGLFFAGQVNGTTGYEEAAGQGLVAGLNAAAWACDLEPLLLDRASSYLGVMIDDLVLQGVTEPYRMLTARAEYRLSMRSDNAETRLSEIGRRLGCLGQERLNHLNRRAVQRQAVRDRLSREWTASALAARGAPVARDGSRRSAFAWLRSADVDAALFLDDPETPEAAELIEDARYAPYLDRQSAEIDALRGAEAHAIPTDFAFAAVPGLSTEMIERLDIARPPSLAAAQRVRGVTPAAVSAIMVQLSRVRPPA